MSVQLFFSYLTTFQNFKIPPKIWHALRKLTKLQIQDQFYSKKNYFFFLNAQVPNYDIFFFLKTFFGGMLWFGNKRSNEKRSTLLTIKGWSSFLIVFMGKNIFLFLQHPFSPLQFFIHDKHLAFWMF